MSRTKIINLIFQAHITSELHLTTTGHCNCQFHVCSLDIKFFCLFFNPNPDPDSPVYFLKFSIEHQGLCFAVTNPSKRKKNQSK